MNSEFYCKGFFDPTPQRSAPPLSPGPGWERPRELTWGDEVLAEGYRRSRGAFYRPRPGGGFSLAYPLDCRRPFPLPALCCFARAECLADRGWWVFSFGPDGLPQPPDA